MIYVDLEQYVYYESSLAKALEQLPGTILLPKIHDAFLSEQDAGNVFVTKIIQSTRKLCMMWMAGDLAIETEKEFWLSSIQEAPALAGANAVNVHYHLEAFILFARASLDIAANIFGRLLPDPFPRERYDSINRVVKNIEKFGPEELREYFSALRQTGDSWFSVLAGTSRGCSLRDRLAHQIEFPIDYVELRETSEKRYPIVYLDGGHEIFLSEFIDRIRNGVVEGYLKLEEACAAAF